MKTHLTRRQAVGILTIGSVAPVSALLSKLAAHESRARASSLYGLEYTHSIDDLIGDLERGPRGDPQRESETPHQHWYSHHSRQHLHSWGPKQRHYEPLEGLEHRSLAWKRERVIATAARFIGYGYQHHHIPDWDPPAHWPWKHTCVGHNGKGVDCSNFTSFVYNQGFGIHMSSGIGEQSELHSAIEGHHAVPIRRIDLSANFAERQKELHTGDLVYILGREGGHVTHVVLWIGSIGRSPGGVPLILDSHGSGVVDDHGQPIPCGIHLRPFREDSWYNRCASHAHRVYHAD